MGHNHVKRYSTGNAHSRREGLREVVERGPVERRWLLGVDRREGGKDGKGLAEEWIKWGLKRQMMSEI